jgi:hypothetical protein
MFVAATLGDFLWSLLVFFFIIIYFILLFQVVIDLFRRHDISGWKKAAWIVFLIIIPYIGVFAYLIINSQSMAERNVREVQQQQRQFDDYVKQVASEQSPADQIAKAKELLDAGTISQEEFDSIKAKAIS